MNMTLNRNQLWAKLKEFRTAHNMSTKGLYKNRKVIYNTLLSDHQTMNIEVPDYLNQVCVSIEVKSLNRNELWKKLKEILQTHNKSSKGFYKSKTFIYNKLKEIHVEYNLELPEYLGGCLTEEAKVEITNEMKEHANDKYVKKYIAYIKEHKLDDNFQEYYNDMLGYEKKLLPLNIPYPEILTMKDVALLAFDIEKYARLLGIMEEYYEDKYSHMNNGWIDRRIYILNTLEEMEASAELDDSFYSRILKLLQE